MKIWFVAGEASGDARAAELMQELLRLHPGLEFLGAGGARMKTISPAIEDWAEEAGVLGLWDVLKKYGWFRTKFRAMLETICQINPEAVILVDYPGFNLRLATALRRKGWKGRLIYYISPQVWAWNRGRIPKMARLLDLMLCIFPFEKELYEASGLKTEFIGHPLVETLGDQRDDQFREENLLGLFPGSRGKEVRRIFPLQLEAARIIKNEMSVIRIEAAAASSETRALMEEMARTAGVPCTIHEGNAHSLMRRATVGLVCSGTATLEAAFFRLPYALVYKAAWLTGVVARRVIKVPYLGIVNILSDREIVREFLQEKMQPGPMAEEMLRLLRNPEARQALVRDLDAAVARLGPPGAAARAARHVIEILPAH